MKILSITAQKPSSTGSGVYLTELVKAFAGWEHEQAVIAGVYKEDLVTLPEHVAFHPVYFRTEELPFAIAGMSDEMPYESTVYGEMTLEMVEQFKAAFRERIKQVVLAFQPDVILCHHLYLMSALAVELVSELPVSCKMYGFCHNTDLRQMKKIPLEREFIREQMAKLDGIFTIHEEQLEDICSIYPVAQEKVHIIGIGYNHHIFHELPDVQPEHKRNRANSDMYYDGPVRMIFAGKLSEKKGLMSLLRSLSYLSYETDKLELVLAGGYGNEEEYLEVRRLAKECPYKVSFLGSIPQTELAEEYNKSDIFILPSFSEGIPLTVVEAMACGDKVVVTDLPGIRQWMKEHVEGAPLVYVTLPKMRNTDEPIEEYLEDFEREIAEKIQECIQMPYQGMVDLSGISWKNICRKILNETGE